MRSRAVAVTSTHHYPHDRRRHRRVPVDLRGRYMLETRQEYPCQAVDMSPGGVLLKAPAIGQVGERVIVYLEQLGRLEGKIARITPDGFAMAIVTTLRKRDKLAAQLTWLANCAVLGLQEDRRHSRIVPRNPFSVMTLSNGDAVNVRLIDISYSGAAFTCDVDLEKGFEIVLGATPARVVRVSDFGVAVEFATPIPDERFNEDIVL